MCSSSERQQWCIIKRASGKATVRNIRFEFVITLFVWHINVFLYKTKVEAFISSCKVDCVSKLCLYFALPLSVQARYMSIILPLEQKKVWESSVVVKLFLDLIVEVCDCWFSTWMLGPILVIWICFCLPCFTFLCILVLAYPRQPIYKIWYSFTLIPCC